MRAIRSFIVVALVASTFPCNSTSGDEPSSIESPNLASESWVRVHAPLEGQPLNNLYVADPLRARQLARCDGDALDCPNGSCFGWLEVEFIISKAGKVSQPRVVSSCPDRTLTRDAARTIQTWRYNPPIRDGTPHSVPAARIRLVYSLGEGA
jgi:TonB family protein